MPMPPETLLPKTEAAFGRLDILVNNAGANTAARSVARPARMTSTR